MAAAYGGNTLEETPTWAVAVVCFVLVAISIVIEHIIHMIGKWLKKKRKGALYEALEKIKSELMLLGFISLLLTVLQDPISDICISKSTAKTWLPCSNESTLKKYYKDGETITDISRHRRLQSLHEEFSEIARRVLAGPGYDKCTLKGEAPFISYKGLHQLHIFIFMLALFHVLYSVTILILSKIKMRSWAAWEMETRTNDYQFSNDPERFRYLRESSFGRRHVNFWSNSPILLWIVCFYRQLFRSVPKVDYLTLRYGFINAHLPPHCHAEFDFQKYIDSSLEKDFKVVVGISPPIWFFAVLFLLSNTYGWYSYLWLPFIPLIIILLVNTKLQVIITRLGLGVQERAEVIQGTPLVQPADDLFWFRRPRLLLYLIHFVLFQNAFQLAFFAWSSYEFKLKSCFHEKNEDIAIRVSMGIIIHCICSYVTLPLYALVTQMGSTMNYTVFSDTVADEDSAQQRGHHNARNYTKQAHIYGTGVASLTSMPETQSHSMSPVHLLKGYKSEPEVTHDNLPQQNNNAKNLEIEMEGKNSAQDSAVQQAKSSAPRLQ